MLNAVKASAYLLLTVASTAAASQCVVRNDLLITQEHPVEVVLEKRGVNGQDPSTSLVAVTLKPNAVYEDEDFLIQVFSGNAGETLGKPLDTVSFFPPAQEGEQRRLIVDVGTIDVTSLTFSLLPLGQTEELRAEIEVIGADWAN